MNSTINIENKIKISDYGKTAKLKFVKRPIETLFYKICLKIALIILAVHILILFCLRKFYRRLFRPWKRRSSLSEDFSEETGQRIIQSKMVKKPYHHRHSDTTRLSSSNEYGRDKYIQLPGVKLFYVENGDTTKPLLLFIHGFPDYWFSWRHQIEHYASMNCYHIVAIDLRGHGNSETFYDKSCYKLSNLAEDLKNLITKLGKGKATIVAHSIGALILYQFILEYPELVEKYVAISAVPPYAFNMNIKQILAFWYVCFFQLPILPEIYLDANKSEIFDEMCEGQNQKVKETYKLSFEKPNTFVGPVNYFRANAVTVLLYSIFGVEDLEKTKLPPGLVIYGLDDKQVLPDSYKTVKTIPGLQIKRIPYGRHYVHQQLPDQVNAITDSFLLDYDQTEISGNRHEPFKFYRTR